MEVQLSYLFLYCAGAGLVVGAVGWKSDSATNLCLVFGLVVEVLLVGSPAQLPVSVYLVRVGSGAVGWKSSSATSLCLIFGFVADCCWLEVRLSYLSYCVK